MPCEFFHADSRLKLHELQAEFAAQSARAVCGQDGGIWAAIWLAAHQDVRMLLLRGAPDRHALRRTALTDAYAVVCPVVLCTAEPDAFPEFPSASVYWIRDEKQLPSLVGALKIANEL